MRSTGQTGPNTTVPFTPEPELPATVVNGAVVPTGRLGLVVVVSAGADPPEGAGDVGGGGAVVVGGAWPWDRNAEALLPQAAPSMATVSTRAANRTLWGGERTVPV